MPIGLLGGIGLAFAGKGLFDYMEGTKQEKADKQHSSMLDHADQLLKSGNAAAAINTYRSAGLEKSEIDQLVNESRRVGNYQNQAAVNTQVDKLSTSYDKSIAAPRQALTSYQVLAEKTQKVNGDFKQWNGADDMMALRSFVKMQNMDKPEAFMSDDAVAATAAAMGIGSLEQMLNIFKGKGTLDENGRRIIMDAMGRLSGSAYKRYTDVRNMYTKRAQARQLQDTTDQWMLPKIQQPQTWDALSNQQRAREELKRRGKL